MCRSPDFCTHSNFVFSHPPAEVPMTITDALLFPLLPPREAWRGSRLSVRGKLPETRDLAPSWQVPEPGLMSLSSSGDWCGPRGHSPGSGEERSTLAPPPSLPFHTTRSRVLP